MTRSLRIAVVGAGPAGMYAAGHLLEGPGGTYLDGALHRLVEQVVEVDVFDRLSTQWGLVRYGVAPDHPEKKLIQSVFERTAARPGFRFYGNVAVGRDVQTRELAQWYDAVIYAIGAGGDAPIELPGQDLPGSMSASAFVAWYNGHPDYRTIDVDLSHQRAVIIGNGNVALDVARILSTPVHQLERTDIADHSLEALRHSKIREVVVLGRRTHIHSAFTCAELEELGELDGVDIIVDPADIANSHGGLAPADPETTRKIATLERFARRPVDHHRRRIILRFLTSAIEILGADRARTVRVVRNRLERDDAGHLHAHPTCDESLIDTGLVLRATGYRGTALPGLPFDDETGVIPSSNGRITDRGKPVDGQYVAGWSKRGPKGIIGTNKKCARDTVRTLLADSATGPLPRAGTLEARGVDAIIRCRQPDLVDQTGWLRIDDHERQTGRSLHRPRLKLTQWTELQSAANG